MDFTDALVVRVAAEEGGAILVTLRTPTRDYEARLRRPHHSCDQARHLRARDFVVLEGSAEELLMRPPCGCLYRVLDLNALPSRT